MENELRRIVDAIPGRVCPAAPDQSVDSFNQRWCEYTGLSLESDTCKKGKVNYEENKTHAGSAISLDRHSDGATG